MQPYYRSRGVVLYHGDARELLTSVHADLLCTDPPYGIQAARKTFWDGWGGSPDYGDGRWDDHPVDRDLIQLARSRARWHIIFGGGVHFDVGRPARCFLIWDKMRHPGTEYADAELAWTNLDQTISLMRYRWNGFERQKHEPRFHPTQKPVDVMAWCIQRSALEKRRRDGSRAAVPQPGARMPAGRRARL